MRTGLEFLVFNSLLRKAGGRKCIPPLLELFCTLIQQNYLYLNHNLKIKTLYYMLVVASCFSFSSLQCYRYFQSNQGIPLVPRPQPEFWEIKKWRWKTCLCMRRYFTTNFYFNGSLGLSSSWIVWHFCDSKLIVAY